MLFQFDGMIEPVKTPSLSLSLSLFLSLEGDNC